MRKPLVIIAIIIFLLVVILSIFFLVGRKNDDAPTVEPDIASQEGQGGEVVNPDEVEEPYVDPFPNDQDRDGLTDTQEEELGTSDIQYDTDGDGLSDLSEINKWKSDPTNPDTDGDGFNDGWEVIKGYSPTGEGTL